MKITKRSAFSALAGAGVLMGAAGLSAAATGPGTDTTAPPAAVVQQVDPTVDPSTPPDTGSAPNPQAESTETPGNEAPGNETAGNETAGNETAGNETAGNEAPDNETNDGPDTEAPDAPPTYTSSVQTTPEDESAAGDAAETDAGEGAQDAALAALATVTPDEASAAASASQPGTVGDVEVSNEAGNVVYQVEVTTADGGQLEVIVDAGNASVLATQAD